MKTQPLYIHDHSAQVRLQGPALSIAEQHKAERLFPIRRLERVSARAGCSWQTSALLACAAAGVSVQFVDAHGLVVARLVGTGHENISWQGRMAQLVSLPGWRKHYEQWCWAQRLQTMRYVANRLGFDYREARQLQLMPTWCEARLCGHYDRRTVARVLQWLHEDFYGLVTQVLQAKGVWGRDEIGARDPIDLAKDIADVLQAVLLLVRDRRMNGPKVSRRATAAWFTRDSGFLHYQVERMLQRLDAWILEMI